MTASPERWATVERLYHAALARPVDERAAFVADACAGDEDLRREVESLLGQRTSEAGEFTQGAVIVAAGLVSNVGLSALTGRRLGVYQILAPIGAGGMGEVYRARDPRLGRDVAIKILPRAFTADAGRLARFEREARVLASLNHPHIAAIYGIEEGPVEGGGPAEAGPHVGADFSRPVKALILELVEGETLGERITRAGSRRLPLKDALDIARQIADALDAAHEKGIVHRDLKPANIKITPQGVVKVLDFGLAKLDVDDASRDVTAAPTITFNDTREGVIVGTAAYMSPEQARGQAVDKRTDIWAFGCVLYEMLTGRAAFAQTTVADTVAAVVDRHPDWNAMPMATPAPVRQLLRRCFEKDPKRRLRDIGEAQFVLDGDEPVPVERSERGPRWFLAAACTGSLVIGLLAAAFYFAWMRPARSSGATTARTIAMQLTNYGGTENAPALSPDGRSFVYVSTQGGTTDIWLRQVSGGDPVRLTNDAAQEADLVYAPDGDSIYFTRTDESRVASVWLTGVLGGQSRKVIDQATKPAPSPDRRHVAFIGSESNTTGALTGYVLRVSSLEGGAPQTLVAHIPIGAGTPRPRWSPDGRWLAYSSGALFSPIDVFIVDTGTGRQRRVLQLPPIGNDVGQPAWLPDSRHLVISYLPFPRLQAPSDLGIIDIEDGSIERYTTTVANAFLNPSVSADGSRVLATGLQYLGEIWKLPFGTDPDSNARAAVRLVDDSAVPMWTSVSRDGRTLLFNSSASGGRNLWTMPTDGRALPHQITAQPNDAISHSSLSPDGTHVAFASIAGGHSDIWTQNVDGSDLRQLTNDEAADSWPMWSPDGASIAYVSFRNERAETWRIPAAGGSAEKILDQFVRGDWIHQPGGTGTWMVTGGVQLIDVEKRTVVWNRMRPDGNISTPTFSSDGKFVSAAFREGADRVIRVFDTATGESRVVARLQFPSLFHVSWTDDDRAFIVNRFEPVSHIVLFDHFWTDVGNTTK